MKLLQMIDIDKKQYDLQNLKSATSVICISQLLLSTSHDVEMILTSNSYQNFLLIRIKSDCCYFYFEMTGVHFADPTFCNS